MLIKSKIAKNLPGDDVLPNSTHSLDRISILPANAETVWPWIVQLGKHRAGCYAPTWLEFFIPKAKRGLRYINPALQRLKVGDVEPDWGGGYLQVIEILPNRALVYGSSRTATCQPVETANFLFSWALTLEPIDTTSCRLHIRLRLRPSKSRYFGLFFRIFGGFIDYLTIITLFAGLRERVCSVQKDT